MRFQRALTSLIAIGAPILSGFALHIWLEVSPKTWTDPQCGLPDGVVLSSLLFLVVPPLLALLRLRQAGKGWSTAIPAAAAVLLLTMGACLVAFWLWFVKHNCGE
jgi:predicted permease